jgi:hypothetical protein
MRLIDRAFVHSVVVVVVVIALQAGVEHVVSMVGFQIVSPFAIGGLQFVAKSIDILFCDVHRLMCTANEERHSVSV